MAGIVRQMVVKPHIPLIKFRKGGLNRIQAPSNAAAAAGPSLSQPSNSPPVGSSPRGTGIEEEFLPNRYYRKPLTPLEMEIIERGGPDIL